MSATTSARARSPCRSSSPIAAAPTRIAPSGRRVLVEGTIGEGDLEHAIEAHARPTGRSTTRSSGRAISAPWRGDALAPFPDFGLQERPCSKRSTSASAEPIRLPSCCGAQALAAERKTAILLPQSRSQTFIRLPGRHEPSHPRAPPSGAHIGLACPPSAPGLGRRDRRGARPRRPADNAFRQLSRRAQRRRRPRHRGGDHYFEEALSADPDNPDPDRAGAHSAHGQWRNRRRRRRSPTRLVAVDKRNPLARLVLAVKALKAGSYAGAETQLTQTAKAPLAVLTAGLLTAWARAGRRPRRRSAEEDRAT